MNKYMKKLAAGLLAFALMVMLLPAGVVVSFAASGKLSFSDPTVSVGDQISVTMKIVADAALGSSDVMLQYDSDALEFVSGTNSNGGAGSVRVIGSAEAADQKTFSFTLKFNALKAGTSSITVKSQEVYDADSKAVTLNHIGSSSVKINAADTSSRDFTVYFKTGVLRGYDRVYRCGSKRCDIHHGQRTGKGRRRKGDCQRK